MYKVSWRKYNFLNEAELSGYICYDTYDKALTVFNNLIEKGAQYVSIYDEWCRKTLAEYKDNS